MEMYIGMIAITLALWFGGLSFLALRLPGKSRYLAHLLLVCAGVMAVAGLQSLMHA